MVMDVGVVMGVVIVVMHPAGNKLPESVKKEDQGGEHQQSNRKPGPAESEGSRGNDCEESRPEDGREDVEKGTEARS